MQLLFQKGLRTYSENVADDLSTITSHLTIELCLGIGSEQGKRKKLGDGKSIETPGS
jgi:hypothetical protein